jgi:hypothetical protein
MDEPLEVPLESFIDVLAASGEWRSAIDAARSVLASYEEGARTDPEAYAPLVERSRARLERLVAEAGRRGEPTAPEPGEFARRIVVQVESERAFPRGAADPADGPRRIIEIADPEGTARADGFDAAIRRARADRRRHVHPSVDQRIAGCADLPTLTETELARKFAVQSALGRALGERLLALNAAGECARRIADRRDLGAADDGYAAYCGLTVAEWFRDRRNARSAVGIAADAMERFVRHRGLQSPGGLPDLVRCGAVLGETLLRLGRRDEARRTVGDVRLVADTLDRTFGGPVGEPGSMPPGWGLPVVMTDREWKSVVRLLHKLEAKLR